MKTSIIDTIQGSPICRVTGDDGAEVVTFIAGAQVDNDGSGGNPEHDPSFQPDTKLHNNGKPLDAETELYVVVPPVIIQRTKGVVMGSMVHCYNQKTKLHTTGVLWTGLLGSTRTRCAGAPVSTLFNTPLTWGPPPPDTAYNRFRNDYPNMITPLLILATLALLFAVLSIVWPTYPLLAVAVILLAVAEIIGHR